MKTWTTLVIALSCAACADEVSDPHDYYPDLPATAKLELIDLKPQLEAWREEGLADPGPCTKLWRITVDQDTFLSVQRSKPGVKSCYDSTRITNNEGSCWYAFTNLGVGTPMMFYVRPHEAYSWGKPEDETLAHEAMHVFSFCALGDGDVGHKNAKVWKDTMGKLFPEE